MRMPPTLPPPSSRRKDFRTGTYEVHRLRKLVRKHYWASAVVLLLLTILCSSSFVSLFFYRHAGLALNELKFRKESNLEIADKDARLNIISEPQALLFFIDLWYRFLPNSSEGIAASAYFYEIRARCV